MSRVRGALWWPVWAAVVLLGLGAGMVIGALLVGLAVR